LADTLLKQNPKSPAGYAVLGWCQYKVGRADDAEKALGIVYASGQINYDAAYFIARLLTDKQKYEEAQKLLAGAVKRPARHVPLPGRCEKRCSPR